jgi:hypothetical protein
MLLLSGWPNRAEDVVPVDQKFIVLHDAKSVTADGEYVTTES